MAFIGYPMGSFDQTFYFPPKQVRIVSGNYARRMAKNPELDYDIAQLIETALCVSRNAQILIGWVIAVGVTSVRIAMCASEFSLFLTRRTPTLTPALLLF